MQTKVSRWGNSLAVRLPTYVVEKIGVHENEPVEIDIREGSVVVTPIRQTAYSLDELLARITLRNRHESIETGEHVGNEVW